MGYNCLHMTLYLFVWRWLFVHDGYLCQIWAEVNALMWCNVKQCTTRENVMQGLIVLMAISCGYVYGDSMLFGCFCLVMVLCNLCLFFLFFYCYIISLDNVWCHTLLKLTLNKLHAYVCSAPGGLVVAYLSSVIYENHAQRICTVCLTVNFFGNHSNMEILISASNWPFVAHSGHIFHAQLSKLFNLISVIKDKAGAILYFL